jgi:hypothetical protein
MAGEGKSAAEGLAAIGSAITSPAKLAFVGYVILAACGKISTSRWEFLGTAIMFFVLQVGHDDWLRIVLNDCVALRGERAKARCVQYPEQN